MDTGKHKKIRFALLIIALLPTAAAIAIEDKHAQPFAGQDLHLVGPQLISYQLTTTLHTLVFPRGFEMSIAANRFSSDTAVVWLESTTTEFQGRTRIDYNATVYLAGNIAVEKAKSAKTIDLTQTLIEQGPAMLLRFAVTGEVFVTADAQQVADPRNLPLYKTAENSLPSPLPQLSAPPKVQQPQPPIKKPEPQKPTEPQPTKPAKKPLPAKPAKPTEITQKPELKFRYPVNFAPAGEQPLQIESTLVDQTNIATVIGRLYVWQRQTEADRLLELLADNAVIFYSTQNLNPKEEKSTTEDILAQGPVKAVYLSGDVVMTEGPRTIRADEIYYDFQDKKALVVNAVMRNFDVKRGIPIYVRAARLRLIAEDRFVAEDITVTSSEFYKPQISLTASSIVINDSTAIDEQVSEVSDSSFDAQMKDVRLKWGETTIFRWPLMRSNMLRPDLPIKSVNIGNDSIFGTSIETQWYLSRLLGLREPEGVESTLELDYFDKRGIGGGAEIDYQREDYFGRLLGYTISDSGEDRLGRNDFRRNLEPPRQIRGRFSWQHRHFMPYNWQLTTGIGYASDENFIEAYFRDDYANGPEETYVHLKRIENNWGLSFLGKGRINDFADELEEFPSGEFHLTGQSLFDDMFTLYSDTQVSRLRQRIGNEHTILMDENAFSFVSHRTELDLPIRADALKVVPFVAGSFGYDDRSGFTRSLVDGGNTGKFGEDKVLLGELGVRVFPNPWWKVYPNARSRLWDLNKLKHIIEPQLTAAVYEENDSAVKQRDTLNFALRQRLQTKRGPAGNQRTVDWMRLDMDVTWVNDSAGTDAGADKFIWSRPIVPLRVFSAPAIFNGDLSPFAGGLTRFELYGPRRNYFGSDYIWRLSDTTALLSDLNFDMQSGVVQQHNVGFSRLLWPNLSYYIGSRYLRRTEILGEKGSNTFTFAATYMFDPRYTVVFSQQFDFDYGANIRSDVTLIRRYHRMFYGFTVSADASLDRQAIVFSIWPQGVPELAIGRRKHVGLGGSAGY